MVVSEQLSHDGALNGNDAFDAEKKRQDVVDLVEKGSAFLGNNSFIEFLRRINHTEDFNVGELYLFIYDTKGVCIAHGRDTRFLWKNLLEEKEKIEQQTLELQEHSLTIETKTLEAEKHLAYLINSVQFC